MLDSDIRHDVFAIHICDFLKLYFKHAQATFSIGKYAVIQKIDFFSPKLNKFKDIFSTKLDIIKKNIRT